MDRNDGRGKEEEIPTLPKLVDIFVESSFHCSTSSDIKERGTYST